MKKKLLIIPAIGLLYVSVSSYSSGPSNTPAGVQTAKSGCGSGGGCHGSQASNANMTISLLDVSNNQPVTDGKYKPGGTYTVSFTELNQSASRFGYIALITDAANAQAGALSNPVNATNIKITNKGGFQVVEQPNAQSPVAGGTGATFTWTAPAAGKGDVTVYVAVNSCNGNGSADAGDTWALKNLTLAEGLPSSVSQISKEQSVQIFPNPASDVINITLGNNNESVKFAVINLNGAVVLSGSVENGSSINVSSLPQGLHIIKLQSKTSNEVSTFTKL